MKRLEVRIYGVVQGISYRFFVMQQATARDLKGMVRNLKDGSVEVVAEGEQGTLRAFLDQLRDGYRFARVERVSEKWLEPSGDFVDFQIA